ncbi:MAG: GIY-YIG nuclease family protein [Flavobacteriia bacterium]|nr:GIY-YIG nuclease family protein [Flavobacteriia bacterium]
MFAVVDVETTGGYAEKHRVIEVGIAISDGERIVERYNQLINPERNIPRHITQLTNISPDDVEDAPTFKDVASQIYDLLQGNVFVAHNVNFDYSFIKRELDEAGYTWQAKKLCTVKLTRAIVPGLKRYSLGNLAEHFNIVNPNPHRALADAETAADILHQLIQIDKEAVNRTLNQRNGESQLPMNLDPEVFHNLPETPGVYYMKDQTGNNLYIGKAINIKQRISQHFTGTSGSKRRQRWIREIYTIETVETGSEALALLHEDHEIRHYWPPYNAAQKHPVAKWGVVSYKDRKNTYRFAVQRAEKRVDVLAHFYSFTAAQQYLAEAVKAYKLDPRLSGLGWEGDVSREEHQVNAERWLKEISVNSINAVLIYPGPTQSEVGFVHIQEGRYAGIGTAPTGLSLESMLEKKWHAHESPTAQQILAALLRAEEVDIQLL